MLEAFKKIPGIKKHFENRALRQAETKLSEAAYPFTELAKSLAFEDPAFYSSGKAPYTRNRDIYDSNKPIPNTKVTFLSLFHATRTGDTADHNFTLTVALLPDSQTISNLYLIPLSRKYGQFNLEVGDNIAFKNHDNSTGHITDLEVKRNIFLQAAQSLNSLHPMMLIQDSGSSDPLPNLA